MNRPTSLRIESLEARDLPSAFGVPWGNARQLTLSLASDGVKAAPIDGYGNYSISELYKELDTAIPRATWEAEVLRAFQTWAAAADINVGLVKDNSTSFGDFEADLGQTPNGELRVGAVPLSPEVAGITTPYHLLSGNRAGDVLLNTAHTYTVGGANGTRDLYSVLLNEVGNALGLDDTADPTSARYGRYTGVRTGLSAADVAAVRGMYGVRSNDLLEGATGNGTTATATPLVTYAPAGAAAGRVGYADGTLTAGDADVYRFTAASDTTAIRVRLNTAGRSLLTGRVEILSSTGQVLASQAVTDPNRPDISLALTSGVKKGATYFVRVTAGRADVFAVGSYQLRVGLNLDPAQYAPAKPAGYVQYGPDGGTDNGIGSARPMAPTPGYAAGTRYAARAELEGGAADRDMYSVVVPAGGRPLAVVLDPGKANAVALEAEVYRGGNTAAPITTLVRAADGRWVGQVSGLAAGEVVSIGVKGRPGTTGSGLYQLAADFNSPAVSTHALVTGQTTTSDTSHRVSVAVPESTFFHFTLAAWSGSGSGSGGRVRMTIVNAAGQVVHSVTAAGGMTSAQAFLAAGTYAVTFQSLNSSGQAQGGAGYRWSGVRLSDPIDVFDPNDTGTQTPPVTVAPLDPADDVVVTAPWSDPIG